MAETSALTDNTQLSGRQLSAWLRLAHTPGISPDSAQRLLSQFKTPQAIFNASQDALQEMGARPSLLAAIRTQPNQLTSLYQRTVAWLEKSGRHIVSFQDGAYPSVLAAIPSPPVLLYVEGDTDLLNHPGIAIVGSRKATPPALDLTRKISSSLAANGLCVISGLAAGIDGAAHVGALEARGATVAVTGNGLDQVYPRRHEHLATKIAATGAIISEFPLGSPPKGHHFPRRNRIISGLSQGLLVVEAALRSGSLSTARHALEQGRDVMAVPGSVNNPLSRGCHALIKSGAVLVESAEDIMTEIALQIDTGPLLASGSATQKSTSGPSGDPQSAALLNYMGYEPVSVDRLIDDAGIPANEVVTALIRLELAGQVTVDSTGRYTRCKA